MAGVVSSGCWGLSKLRLGNLSLQTKKPPLLLMVARRPKVRSVFGMVRRHWLSHTGIFLSGRARKYVSSGYNMLFAVKGKRQKPGKKDLCNLQLLFRDDFFHVSEIWWKKTSLDCWDTIKVLVKMSRQWMLTRCLQNNLFGNNITRP